VEGSNPIVLCPICEESASSHQVRVRSGKEMVLWHCAICEYDFFAHDPTSSLAANKLDKSRLKASGLDIPTRDADFINGLKQSRHYIEEYFDTDDKGANILEVGCSWGYFLKLARDAGASPFGIEVNSLRAQYVNNDLKIPCFSDIESCESSGIRFHKIFLFYVLEYIPQPVTYIQRLINMLEEGGSLIIITPNLNDALKDLYRNEGFLHFFYDEHAINYFSLQSIRQIVRYLNKQGARIETRQGYSFINHINWFLTKAPRTTNVVGGDNFVSDFIELLRPDSQCVPGWENKHYIMAGELADLIHEFDRNYRQILEKRGYGNQIRCIIDK
jgi:2-polyprenyl-3-methyl-5-hydroxy-6-metoxy-1,4-benzoquinol methylase